MPLDSHDEFLVEDISEVIHADKDRYFYVFVMRMTSSMLKMSRKVHVSNKKKLLLRHMIF